MPIVRLLLEHRSPLDATDADGWTALHHAVAEGRGDVALCLLLAGAESGKRDVGGRLAMDGAPDLKVGFLVVSRSLFLSLALSRWGLRLVWEVLMRSALVS